MMKIDNIKNFHDGKTICGPHCSFAVVTGGKPEKCLAGFPTRDVRDGWIGPISYSSTKTPRSFTSSDPNVYVCPGSCYLVSLFDIADCYRSSRHTLGLDECYLDILCQDIFGLHSGWKYQEQIRVRKKLTDIMSMLKNIEYREISVHGTKDAADPLRLCRDIMYEVKEILRSNT